MGCLTHPLRREILKAIYDRGEAASSPRELADKFDQPLSNLSYHVRLLADENLISLRRTEPRRGAVAHYYGCGPAMTNNPLVLQLLGIEGGGTDEPG
jgi:DNA-binding transcriptional ArsR family regulator